MKKFMAEYIWIDGQKPTAKLRSKTKIIDGVRPESVSELPEWGYDGSSTYQAEGKKSDLALHPVRMITNPLRDDGRDILVLCEVMMPDGTPHPSNMRAPLRQAAERFAHEEAWFGMEQEYTLFEGNRPLGWPDHGFPAPQGGYYCGVGSDEVFGRHLVDSHADACIRAGLHIVGTNAEVMPAQWEFQIGPLGPLDMADELWLARWLLYRMGEDYGISATLHPKPVKGDWNGAGCHTNVSTKATRAPGGMKVIEAGMAKLEARHEAHIAVYGAHNVERLTGLHETAPIHTFRWGVSDRGSSIRIPLQTAKSGHGYFEDRRPAANCDPYEVLKVILETFCT
ncbi:glutamine synthetase beta-grasp domain-containing protein [Myxococcota bacterium]|nr:glutamine synthetase beta-grasp domain-containing protein [Myxococcota bacterium]